MNLQTYQDIQFCNQEGDLLFGEGLFCKTYRMEEVMSSDPPSYTALPSYTPVSVYTDQPPNYVETVFPASAPDSLTMEEVFPASAPDYPNPLTMEEVMPTDPGPRHTLEDSGPPSTPDDPPGYALEDPNLVAPLDDTLYPPNSLIGSSDDTYDTYINSIVTQIYHDLEEGGDVMQMEEGQLVSDLVRKRLKECYFEYIEDCAKPHIKAYYLPLHSDIKEDVIIVIVTERSSRGSTRISEHTVTQHVLTSSKKDMDLIWKKIKKDDESRETEKFQLNIVFDRESSVDKDSFLCKFRKYGDKLGYYLSDESSPFLNDGTQPCIRLKDFRTNRDIDQSALDGYLSLGMYGLLSDKDRRSKVEAEGRDRATRVRTFFKDLTLLVVS